jgi:hypothetical protein
MPILEQDVLAAIGKKATGSGRQRRRRPVRRGRGGGDPFDEDSRRYGAEFDLVDPLGRSKPALLAQKVFKANPFGPMPAKIWAGSVTQQVDLAYIIYGIFLSTLFLPGLTGRF